MANRGELLLFLLAVLAATISAVLLLASWLVAGSNTSIEEEAHSSVLRIFCAGSLKIPLEEVAQIFREKYGVDVEIEASGSVMAIRKIVNLGKHCDVLAVADYKLIPKFMAPKYVKWYIAFASNEIVLAYTNTSKYADEIERNPNKWFEILARPDVRYGFSDPNKDPCGYRAVSVIALASIYYNDTNILEKLLIDKTNIQYSKEGDRILLSIPASLEVKSENLIVRPKSIDLIALLEAGSLDYAFEYKSVAVQHGLKYIELPMEINLRSPSYSSFYSRVVVKILAGTSKEKEIVMAPIVYGVTVPATARNPELGVAFVKLLLSSGRDVFREMGQPFLEKPVGYGEVPEELREYVWLSKS